MKKISNIKNLQLKKMELRIKQLEQEKNIRNNWEGLRKSLNPEVFTKHRLPENKIEQTLKGRILTDMLGFGAGILSKKFTEIAGKKIEAIIHSGIIKLTKKSGLSHKT
jgi:Flp pilus assembly protein CpaB